MKAYDRMGSYYLEATMIKSGIHILVDTPCVTALAQDLLKMDLVTRSHSLETTKAATGMGILAATGRLLEKFKSVACIQGYKQQASSMSIVSPIQGYNASFIHKATASFEHCSHCYIIRTITRLDLRKKLDVSLTPRKVGRFVKTTKGSW